jgi:hypothetical protein
MELGQSWGLKEDGSTYGCGDFKGALEKRRCFGWKVGFIKDNIAGKVDFLRVKIKAPIATFIGTIS